VGWNTTLRRPAADARASRPSSSTPPPRRARERRLACYRARPALRLARRPISSQGPTSFGDISSPPATFTRLSPRRPLNGDAQPTSACSAFSAYPSATRGPLPSAEEERQLHLSLPVTIHCFRNLVFRFHPPASLLLCFALLRTVTPPHLIPAWSFSPVPYAIPHRLHLLLLPPRAPYCNAYVSLFLLYRTQSGLSTPFNNVGPRYRARAACA
jgi:hypothetical protein